MDRLKDSIQLSIQHSYSWGCLLPRPVCRNEATVWKYRLRHRHMLLPSLDIIHSSIHVIFLIFQFWWQIYISSFLACSFTGRPTLPELLRFIRADKEKINIAKEVGDEYKCFGTLLLEDDNGQKVTSMESKHHSDPSKINTRILQEWLNGKGKQPITWTTLVEVMHDTGLSTLANDISTIKCPTSK